MKIILDGTMIPSKKELFSSLKAQINSDEFYGNNLDALYDVLSFLSEDMIVTINHYDQLLTNLGEYANALVKLFNELKIEKSNFDLQINR